MMIYLWLFFLGSVDSGEALFERAMSLPPSQAQLVFSEAAESFVKDAATNPNPNVVFNAGLAWAQAGNRPKAKQMLQYAVARGATPEAWRALQLVREQDGPDGIQEPMPWFAPVARLGVAMATLVPMAPMLGGGLLFVAGVLWGMRRTDLAGLTLVAALVLVIPLFSRSLPIAGAIAAAELIPSEGPGDGYAATNAVLKSGDEIKMLRTAGQWCEIDLPGPDWRRGWVRRADLLFPQDALAP
ncbi:MAG: hypothetical protein CMJ37_05370 [Phycisphaerae bacterium]|nr:hypothetical protein [Phycisphaerae bacterium]